MIYLWNMVIFHSKLLKLPEGNRSSRTWWQIKLHYVSTEVLSQSILWPVMTTQNVRPPQSPQTCPFGDVWCLGFKSVCATPNNPHVAAEFKSFWSKALRFANSTALFDEMLGLTLGQYIWDHAWDAVCLHLPALDTTKYTAYVYLPIFKYIYMIWYVYIYMYIYIYICYICYICL